jgi:hypothetical protein
MPEKSLTLAGENCMNASSGARIVLRHEIGYDPSELEVESDG